MQTHRIKTLALCITSLVLMACASESDDSAASDYTLLPGGQCQQALTDLTGLQLPLENRLHRSLESFKKSKPSIDPLVIHQFHSGAVGDSGQFSTVSCKFKSADFLNRQLSLSLLKKSCGDLNKISVERARQSLVAAGVATLAQVSIDSDQEVSRGSQYIDPWPFKPIRERAGKLHLQAKQLYVSSKSWAPLPTRFKGVHYCHLVADDYIKGILAGDISLPASDV